MKEAPEQANDYVRELEAEIMCLLIHEVFLSQKSWLGCGCPSCTRKYEADIDRMDNEWMRQLPEDRANIYAIVTGRDKG